MSSMHSTPSPLRRTALALGLGVGICFSQPALADIHLNPAAMDTTQIVYLDQPNNTYVLDGDINFKGAGFALIAQNIKLDLSGHTVTFDNKPVVPVPNGDFENGSTGWDFSQAPKAVVKSGTYVQPETVYSGTKALNFSMPAGDQSVTSTQSVTLEAGTYSLSFMAYNPEEMRDSNATLYVQLSDSIKAARTGQSYRGFQYSFVTFTLTQTQTFNLKAGISGATAQTGTMFIDDIQIRPAPVAGAKIGDYAISVGAVNWDPRYGNFTRFGNGNGAIVTNGKIVQGSGATVYGGGVHIMAAKDITVSNLDITIAGPANTAIWSDYSNGTQIFGNTIHNNVKTVETRDWLSYGSAIAVTGDLGGTGFSIHDNIILGGPQNGIIGGGQTCKIYNNKISLTSTYTNDFAISFWHDVNSEVYGNHIDCTSDPSYSCRGIGAGGGSTGTIIHDNVVSVQELNRNQEYNGGEMGGAYGIQIETAHDIQVYNNDVTAIGTDAAEGSAFRSNPETLPAGPYNVYNNKFTAIQKGSHAAYPVKIDTIYTSDLLIFKNNYLSTNSRLMWNTDVSNIVFDSNTIDVSNVTSDTKLLWDSNWDPSLIFKDIVFLNNIYANAGSKAALESPTVYNTYSLAPDPRTSFSLMWNVNLTAKDISGNVVSNANVVIKDALGTQVANGVTDSAGKYAAVLTQLKTAGAVITNTSNYTVEVTSGTVKATQSVVLDRIQNLNVTLGGASTITAPSAVTASADKTSGVAPLAVVFTASADGTSPSYSWNFGDGSTGSGASVSHSYSAAGNYTATVTASNSAGNVSQSVTVTVTAPPPVVTAPSNLTISADKTSGVAPLAVHFTASAQGTSPTYSWVFGNNATGTGASVSTTYSAAGTYTATVVASNSAGNVSKSVTITVTAPPPVVTNLTPTANPTWKVFNARKHQISFTANASDPETATARDPDGKVTYQWNFGDGSNTSNNATPSHNYAKAGTYTVTLTVTDNAGASVTKTLTVNVP